MLNEIVCPDCDGVSDKEIDHSLEVLMKMRDKMFDVVGVDLRYKEDEKT
jgi:hypothetical protein